MESVVAGKFQPGKDCPASPEIVEMEARATSVYLCLGLSGSKWLGIAISGLTWGINNIRANHIDGLKLKWLTSF